MGPKLPEQYGRDSIVANDQVSGAGRKLPCGQVSEYIRRRMQSGTYFALICMQLTWYIYKEWRAGQVLSLISFDVCTGTRGPGQPLCQET